MLSAGLSITAGAAHRRQARSIVPFKAVLLGQSEDFYVISPGKNTLPPDPLAAEGLATFWWHDRIQDGAAGVQSVTLDAETVANDARVTAGMVAMANVFLRRLPGRPVHLVMLAVSGTNPREIMDDAYMPGNTAAAKRRWQDDWAVHDSATADGVPVQWGWHSWFAGPGSYAGDYGKAFAAYLWGRDLDGNLLTYSEEDPLSLDIGGTTWVVSRTLREMFGGDGPAWAAMGGAHRFIDTTGTDLQNATAYVGGAPQDNLINTQRSTVSWRALVESAAFAGRVSATGMHLNAHSIGEPDGAGGWTDEGHPSGWTDEGINYRARQTAHAILRGAGITSYGLPVIDNAEWQDDGSYMEFWSSAGAITTLRAAAGDPALPAAHPHWTEVSGVQVDGAPAQRADLVAGRVRVYPNDGGTFTSTTSITFGEGGASGSLKFPLDQKNALYRDFPIIDVGLSDVPGLALSHLPDADVMASTVPGDPTFTTAAAGPYFADPNAIAAVSRMTFLFEGAVDFAATGGGGDYGGISGARLRIQVLTGGGRLRFTVRDSAGTYLMNNQLSPGGLIQGGVDHKVLVSLDLSAQVFRLWVDNVLEMDVSLPSNSGALEAARQIVLGRFDTMADSNSQIVGSWRRMAVWKEYTADGSLPASAPYDDISGNAVAVNAHPWKRGSDAP